MVDISDRLYPRQNLGHVLVHIRAWIYHITCLLNKGNWKNSKAYRGLQADALNLSLKRKQLTYLFNLREKLSDTTSVCT